MPGLDVNVYSLPQDNSYILPQLVLDEEISL